MLPSPTTHYSINLNSTRNQMHHYHVVYSFFNSWLIYSFSFLHIYLQQYNSWKSKIFIFLYNTTHLISLLPTLSHFHKSLSFAPQTCITVTSWIDSKSPMDKFHFHISCHIKSSYVVAIHSHLKPHNMKSSTCYTSSNSINTQISSITDSFMHFDLQNN